MSDASELRIWAAVDELVDRAPGVSDLHYHRLKTFAARRWRALGRAVPPELEEEERLAGVATLSAVPVLERVRAACDGPLLLLKGPEVAASYPDPTLRPYRDLDLLVPDSEETHRALVAAGFEVVEGKHDELHHRAALLSPGLPLIVEVHGAPKWPDWVEAPSWDELASIAVPARTAVADVQTLPAQQHAVLLAAHAWAHVPLRRLLDLIDVVAMAGTGDRRELEQVARAWGVERLWRTTIASADALLLGGPMPRPLRTWARNLPAVRARTVFENHLERLLAPFSAMPPAGALRTSASEVAGDLRPASGETWRSKLARTGLAIRHARVREPEHQDALERRGD